MEGFGLPQLLNELYSAFELGGSSALLPLHILARLSPLLISWSNILRQLQRDHTTPACQPAQKCLKRPAEREETLIWIRGMQM